jgi:hypothetical protein
MKYYSTILLFTIFILASCASSEEPTPIKKENLVDPLAGGVVPPDSTPTTMGTFTGFAHSLAGNTVLYTDAQGMRTLRFENFTMTQGPDVYVLFSKTNNYSQANTIAISMLKGAYNNTSLNFEVGNSIDVETYKFVLVYCVQFSSLFGYSEL